MEGPEALAAGRVRLGAGGAGEFDPGLIDSSLAGFPVRGELTGEQPGQAERVIAGRPDAELAGALAALPVVQRQRGRWWVSRVRAAAGWADQAARYLSGDPAAALTAEQRWRLVVRLLTGLASIDDRWLALQLLEAAHDEDLADMLADRAGATAVLDAGIPPGHVLRESLEKLLARRFGGGLDAVAAGAGADRPVFGQRRRDRRAGRRPGRAGRMGDRRPG